MLLASGVDFSKSPLSPLGTGMPTSFDPVTLLVHNEGYNHNGTLAQATLVSCQKKQTEDHRTKCL